MLPPLPVRVVELPLQIVTLEPALITGSELTLTVTAAVFTHPFALVPTTVYVVVVVGFAIRLAHVLQESPVVGVHIYDTAPVAFSVVLAPRHIATFEPALTTGNGFTETVTDDAALHPAALVPVTVYVLVTVLVVVGAAQVVHDKPVAGVHV